MEQLKPEMKDVEIDSTLMGKGIVDLNQFKRCFPKLEKPNETKDLLYAIYFTAKTFPIGLSEVNPDDKICVAGSAAMVKLAEFLGIPLSWQATDTDIFFLDSPKLGRTLIGNCDLVATTFPTIEEFLESFDLPCCRVAYSRSRFYFTRQAINALLYGEYWIAEIIEDWQSYCRALKQIPNQITRNEFFKKTQERIRKYMRRGMIGQTFQSRTIPAFLGVRKAYSRYCGEIQPTEYVSLVFDLWQRPLSTDQLYSIVKYDQKGIVASMKFEPELKQHLVQVLSPKHGLFQETIQKHQQTISRMWKMLEKPILASEEQQFREAMKAELLKLERLFLSQKI